MHNSFTGIIWKVFLIVFVVAVYIFPIEVHAVTQEVIEAEFNDFSCELSTNPNITIGNEMISVSTTARAAGAIESLKINGKEIVNIYDHGRQIQYATQLDNKGECLNPTEAGNVSDGLGQTSTSKFIEGCKSSPTKLYTKNQAAYWFKPAMTSTTTCGTYTTAQNTTVLSNDYISKIVEVGYKGLNNVVRFSGRFTINESWWVNFAEGPVYYLKRGFNKFYKFDLYTGTLIPLSVSSEFIFPFDEIPVISDGTTYIAIFNPKQLGFFGYGVRTHSVGANEDSTSILTTKYRTFYSDSPSSNQYMESFLIATDADNYKRDIYKLLSTVSWNNVSPQSHVDISNADGSGRIAGWTFDANNMNKSLDVHIYKDGKVGQGGTLVGFFTADRVRSDVNSAFQIEGNHGFDVNLNSYTELKGAHDIYLYAIDDVYQMNILINQSPIPFTSSVTPTSTSTPVACPGDINGDSVVNLVDYSVLVKYFLKPVSERPSADLNDDNLINLRDYAILVKWFLKPC